VSAGTGKRGRAGVGQQEEEPEPEKAAPESIIRQELRKAKAGQDEGTLNIAPRTADWDLKRYVCGLYKVNKSPKLL
jgi:hypothetical protein